NKVFVVHSEGDGFVVKSALVQIKKFLGESVEITHSLEDGALIVSRGVQKLFDNAPVKFEFQGT
ncbi:MAG: hypothetical protein NZT61_05455, partial [Deltaproteobacteria bacterium]|nr:hypothetical protein [Deltaproteobacteria bacterium]